MSICKSVFTDLAVGFDASLMLVKILNKDSFDIDQMLEKLGSHIDLPPFEAACVLCTRSKIYHLVGKSDKAQDILTAAKAIAREFNLSAESLLVRQINDVAQFLTQES